MAPLIRIPWWQTLLAIFSWRIVGSVDDADEIPLDLPRNGAILVGPRKRPKWIVFDCPCRTGHRIMLNTDRARSPYWKVTTNGSLTISPSVDYRSGDKSCHYFIRKGRTVWAYERTHR
jgi:hypothetical protein